jgi:hypothetical protein
MQRRRESWIQSRRRWTLQISSPAWHDRVDAVTKARETARRTIGELFAADRAPGN